MCAPSPTIWETASRPTRERCPRPEERSPVRDACRVRGFHGATFLLPIRVQEALMLRDTFQGTPQKGTPISTRPCRGTCSRTGARSPSPPRYTVWPSRLFARAVARASNCGGAPQAAHADALAADRFAGTPSQYWVWRKRTNMLQWHCRDTICEAQASLPLQIGDLQGLPRIDRAGELGGPNGHSRAAAGAPRLAPPCRKIARTVQSRQQRSNRFLLGD
jgi:hypothetical protein